MSTLNRRQLLKRAFGFSAAALLSGGRPDSLLRAALAAPKEIEAGACHLLSVGDFGVREGDLPRQKAVSDAMVRYIEKARFRPNGLALLGDNFYGGLSGKGVRSPRWEQNIEGMYPAKPFDCPLYAMLGNHDYNDEKNAASAKAQLEYREKNPGSRWTLPGKWYKFELGGGGKGDGKGGNGDAGGDPLATVLVIDTNFPSSRALSADEREEQFDWLSAELKKPRKTPWLFVFGHHPLYSNGSHGDSGTMIKALDPLFREHEVDLYLCGHDHDLQHIEFEKHPTSFVISGGGGARARPLKNKSGHKPFGQAVYGFSHLELHKNRFTVRHVDANGKLLHAFTKNEAGVKVHGG